ncbi:MAG: sulfotransferase [SAR324 cluster bacterium]|nr:sulfotransferase [SAR324 cluster bacterium]
MNHSFDEAAAAPAFFSLKVKRGKAIFSAGAWKEKETLTMLFSNPEKLLEDQKRLSEQNPVVLMGRGHSGTRVLSWICTELGVNLGTSASLATGDADDQKFTQEIKKITTNNIGTEMLRPSDLQRFQKAVSGYYGRLNHPQTLWGWKFPETYLIPSYIAETFPKARYIHLVRDGRDIAFKQHLTDDPKRKLGKKILESQNALGLPHHLQAAVSWAFQVDNFDNFRGSVSGDQVLDVLFEDICTRPYEIVEELCDFLKLSITKRCDSYIKEQINVKKVAQYKENDPRLVQEVENRIRPTLTRYHYLS